MTDFSDKDQARIWFQEQPHYNCVSLASRIALRVLPFSIKSDEAPIRIYPGIERLFLHTFRALELSFVAARWPNAANDIKFEASAAAVAVLHENVRQGELPAAYSAVNAAYAVSNKPPAITTAHSAYLAAAEADADITFEGLSADASEIENGVIGSDLCRRPLFPNHTIDRCGKRWEDLKDSLLKADAHWSVWTDWFEDRIHGESGFRSRRLMEALEKKRVKIPESEWEFGPSYVNELIAGIEADYRAEVPEQKPASQTFVLGEDGILHRRAAPSPVSRTADQENRLRDAWKAHEDILKSVEILNPGRNSTALESALKAYRRAMGDTYEKLNVIALGIHGARISAIAERADEILMADAAAEVVALAASHGMLMPQFNAWNEWLAGAREQLPQDVVNSAAKVAFNIAQADDLADDEVQTDLTDIAEAAITETNADLRADPAERPPREVQRDLILVVGNALSAYLGPVLEAARNDSVEAIRWAYKRALSITALEGMGKLIELLPGDYSWVSHLVSFIKGIAKDLVS